MKLPELMIKVFWIAGGMLAGFFWLMATALALWEPVRWILRGFKAPPTDYHHVSPVPFVGGIAGLVVLSALPLPSMSLGGWILIVLLALLPELVIIPQLLYSIIFLGIFRR